MLGMGQRSTQTHPDALGNLRHSVVYLFIQKSGAELDVIIRLCACRVPEECPQWVADLIAACVYFDPAQRLTSKDVYHALLADNFEAS